MSLITAKPPNAILTAFSTGLPAFLSGGPPGTVVSETFVGTPPHIPSAADVGMVASGSTLSAPNVTAVLQAYVLGLEGAAHNTGVLSPAHTGWQVFAGDTNDKTVVGRVVLRRQGWKLVAVHYGELVFQALKLSQLLTGSPPALLKGADYELRLLSIPGLNLEVFWLAASNGGSQDYIVQAPTLGKPALQLGSASSPLETSHFLALIRPLASSLLTIPPGYGA